jgi:hypothetical protein
MAVRRCVALVAVAVFQLTEYGEVVTSAPRLVPSSWNWTPAIPRLSVALAATVITPETVWLFAGEVIDTMGPCITRAAVVAITAVVCAELFPAASYAETA